MTVLGISLGTERTGVCVLKDGDLRERYVHYFRGQLSPLKLRTVVNQYRQYVLKHDVTAIMVMVPPLESSTPGLLQLMRRVETLAAKHKCTLDMITKKRIKSTLMLRSNSEIVKYAKMLYPEMSDPDPAPGSYKKKMYEAVLAAHIYNDWLNKKAE